jgi:hypothetical protein
MKEEIEESKRRRKKEGKKYYLSKRSKECKIDFLV